MIDAVIDVAMATLLVVLVLAMSAVLLGGAALLWMLVIQLYKLGREAGKDD